MVILGNEYDSVTGTQDGLVGITLTKGRRAVEIPGDIAVTGAVYRDAKGIIVSVAGARAFGPNEFAVVVVLGDEYIVVTRAGQDDWVGIALTEGCLAQEISRDIDVTVAVHRNAIGIIVAIAVHAFGPNEFAIVVVLSDEYIIAT